MFWFFFLLLFLKHMTAFERNICASPVTTTITLAWILFSCSPTVIFASTNVFFGISECNCWNIKRICRHYQLLLAKCLLMGKGFKESSGWRQDAWCRVAFCEFNWWHLTPPPGNPLRWVRHICHTRMEQELSLMVTFTLGTRLAE